MDMNDDSRLRVFRQMKREVRGSEEYLLVGIDVAKDRHDAFFGSARGKTFLKKLVFDTTREGFEKLCLHADTIRVQHGLKKIAFGLEPTADYYKPVGEYLIRRGHRVVLVAGSAVKKTGDGISTMQRMPPMSPISSEQGKCLFYEFPFGS